MMHLYEVTADAGTGLEELHFVVFVLSVLTDPNFAQNGLEKTIGQGSHLLIRAILDGVRYEDNCRIEAQSCGLRLGRFNEFGRGNEYRRYASPF